MNTYAPVLIITLNRFEHFKRCVQSLSKCTHADKTDLFIALDYPANESHRDGYQKINDFIYTIKGFNSINIIKRNENFGVMKNFLEANSEIFNTYDRIIFSEDDNEFSPNFLDYLNKGLDKFELDKRITSICGYNYPINFSKSYKYNYYYSKAFSAWGYGIWKDRYQKFLYSTKELIDFMNNRNYVIKSYKMAPQKPLSILENILNNTPLYGDGVVSLENIKKDKYCIFPTTTKVKNYGHDGTGVHCNNLKDDIFLNQILDIDYYFNYTKNPPIMSSLINKSLRKYFKLTLKAKIKLIIYYCLLKLNLLRKI